MIIVLGLAGVLPLALASTGIANSERLLFSDGSWHRAQRKHIAFETSCYYTHETELPYGCHFSTSSVDTWSLNSRRIEQKRALLDLYTFTMGDLWRANDNWADWTDPCWDSWFGVTCDEHGHVISLELVDNGLQGPLPGSLGNLVSLLKLDLSTTAPDYHGHPNPHANRIVGPLPSLALVTRLEEVEISGNQITAFPEELWMNGATLRVISASHNLITALPRNVQRFTALQTLELGNNLITDNFPAADFGALQNLRVLQLEYNFLRGSITDDIRGMRRVQVFDVSHNPLLAGQLPEEVIVEWEDSQYLSIINTSVSGYISSLCLDVPFCWKFMYDTHKDLTWASQEDVPDIVDMTINLAGR